MGVYFSLHDAALWEAAITETLEPSIWSNVRHSPLANTQRLLLERPGRVSYNYPHGMRHGTNLVQVSEASEVSLLVGFEEEAGRLYAGVLLRASNVSPHYYCREMEEVALSHPAAVAHAAAMASFDPASPSGSGLPDNTLKLAGRLLATGSATINPLSPKNGGSTLGSRAGATSPKDNGGSGLQLEQFNQGSPMQRTGWDYMLLYVVKEGVLVFFSNDVAGCEEVVREIAHTYGHTPPVPQDLPPPLAETRLSGQSVRGGPVGVGPGTAAAASLASALKVKCVEHCVGRAPPACTKLITDLLKGDLQRRFAVRCEAEEQPDHTNCVVFCLRAMMALQLSVRGYDIRRVCESRSDLGHKAGEAAQHAWEQLHRRVRA